MIELGKLLHVAKSGRIIVKVSNAARDKKITGRWIVDSAGRNIGRIQEIFGPVGSPYASVQPSQAKLTGIIGTKVYISEEDSLRSRRRTGLNANRI